MSALGALLVLWGAGGLYVLRRRQDMLNRYTYRALLEDLAVLRRQICLCRAPLPAILAKELCRGPGGPGPLGAPWPGSWSGPRRERGSPSPGAGRRQSGSCPSRWGELLAPLGPLLPAGGRGSGPGHRRNERGADQVSAAGAGAAEHGGAAHRRGVPVWSRPGDPGADMTICYGY